MTLLDYQFEFVRSITRLYLWLHENEYECTLGESFRTQEQCDWYAARGMGIRDSNHVKRCAQDLNIFKRGVWLTTVDELKDVGIFWESFSATGIKHVWGGSWEPPDANHFSFSINGKA